MTVTLSLTGEYAYANGIEVRLWTLTDIARILRLGGTTLIVEGINFAWLAVRGLSPEWLSRKSDNLQALRWGRRAWGWGECGT